MTGIGVVGAGAFGTALAISLASDGSRVTLWGRDAGQMRTMAADRENRARLPGRAFPGSLSVTATLSDLAGADAVLLVVPAQQTEAFLAGAGDALGAIPLVMCAKGITREGQKLQTALVPQGRPVAVLSGPGFATEIAAGLPTALTLAATDTTLGAALQTRLARPALRLYLSDDPVGVQLGGAMKNVIALAAGAAIGAGLGESARAAIMTRGFAELTRMAVAAGARADTLAGLSGLGDLALTCASPKSRNFAHGLALGQGARPDKATVEGIATAQAACTLGAQYGVEMPIAEAVVSVLQGAQTVAEAMAALLARPLGRE